MTAAYNGGGGVPAVPPERKRGAFRRFFAWFLAALLLAAFLNVRVRIRERERTPSAGAEYPSYLPGTGVEVPEYVRPRFLTKNKYSRPGTYLERIDGLVIHYVGNPGSSADANRNYFESLSDGRLGVYASSHFIVGLQGETVQCVPLTEIAYASNQRNRDTVSIEVCHPDEGGQFNDLAYERLIELAGWLCWKFDIDPASDVIRHYDVSGKLCPLYYVEHPAAWEALRGDIAAVKARLTAEAQTADAQTANVKTERRGR